MINDTIQSEMECRQKSFFYNTKNPSDERFLLYFYASVVIGNVSCVKQGDNDSQYTFPFFFGICIRICHTILLP